MNEHQILDRIKTSYQKILTHELTGIYVHGSIAFGCFNWDTSDIDFLVVVRDTLSFHTRMELLKVLLDLEPQCPPKGLEMSVVPESVCRDFQYPTPFLLHYSKAHHDRCAADLQKYCLDMHGADKDLAAHFTVIRKAGIAIYGKRIPDVFSEVPKEDYLDSIRYDVADAAKEIGKNPVYMILNLCRVLAYIRDGKVLSKKEGGQWGMENLPEGYQGLISGAAYSYCNNRPFPMNLEACQGFAGYMIKQIFPETR